MISSPGKPLVYLISDGLITNENYDRKGDELLQLIESAVRFRIPLIQLREKQLSGWLLSDLASRVVAIIGDTDTRVLINDRLDIALAAGADGVHLPANSFTAGAVRKVAHDDFLIGVSTHSADEIEQAKQDGADFVVLGPVFETPGKDHPLGLDALRNTVEQFIPFPIIALGGIDETNYHDILDAGAAGFAAIRFLNNASNLEKLSSELGL